MIMDNKINIAELLKDSPKGMELDCTMFENVFFDCVTDNPIYPIRLYVQSEKDSITLTSFGCTTPSPYAKCVIFPKGKTTWEGFVPPCKFKEGDVVISDYGDIHLLRTEDSSYCAYRHIRKNKLDSTMTTNITVVRLATEEEKERLFDTIKENGYRWNTETKTLDKLPKFKVGDVIQDIDTYKVEITEVNIEDECYGYESTTTKGIKGSIGFSEQDNWELVPNKFDITTLIPFESKVLVRGDEYCLWEPAIFGFYNKANFYMLGGTVWRQCIPYEGNKHLLGTTNDCDEFYKTW